MCETDKENNDHGNADREQFARKNLHMCICQILHDHRRSQDGLTLHVRPPQLTGVEVVYVAERVQITGIILQEAHLVQGLLRRCVGPLITLKPEGCTQDANRVSKCTGCTWTRTYDPLIIATREASGNELD